MNIWSDLVSWRQHVFTSINKAYLPLIPHINSQNAGTPTSSYAYRGYHETAWIINRFAHVARKHRLPDVCISSLGRIYTLPNIEIQEAFYKLREQAKCHKDVLGEYSAALDVINNTNLLYFNPSQKAEFFTIRGTFLSKLNLHEEANIAFSSAVQMDSNLPICWAAIGEYNDRLFEQNPEDLKYATEALNCYLISSGMYNNGRSRKLLSRILWLLSLDDETNTLMNVYDIYNAKGECPVWYWITFIPELIGSLAGGKEATFARNILIKIAKTYPQALHFQLRTAKDDFSQLKEKYHEQNGGAGGMESATGGSQASAQSVVLKEEKEEEEKEEEEDDDETEKKAAKPAPSTPWDCIEEIMSILKTAYPLMALTMETMVDQVVGRLKPTTDEDIYRLIAALLNDGVQVSFIN
jgi:transformation/transcription domain-associated protein